MPRRRSRYGYSYGDRHISERKALTHALAGIDADIERIFLALPNAQLEAIFVRYGFAYGAQAESYARKTYQKWKSQSVRISGQTAERLINLVPPCLSVGERFDLIKKLRAGHLQVTTQRVVTAPESWIQDLAEPIKTLVGRSAAFQLPDYVIAKAAWLANGDAAAAQSLLAAAEQEEAIIRIRYLDAEFKRIESLIANIEHTRSVTHEISLPQGTIFVTIALPPKSLWKKLTSWIS